MKRFNQIIVLSMVWAALTLFGCAAAPAEDSGYLEGGAQMTKIERLPFHRAWVRPGFERDKYTELHVAPINTEYLFKTDMWKEILAQKPEMRDDALAIAAHFHESMVNATKSDPKGRFKIVDKPGPKTLILELAIVELKHSDEVLATLGLVLTPVPGPAGAVVNGCAKSSVAIEGRVRDGATKEVYVMFADREESAARPLDVGALYWWKYTEEICDDWAEQIITIANTPRDEVVKDTPDFTLMPW